MQPRVPGDRVQVAPAQRRWPKFGLPEFLRVGFTLGICQQFVKLRPNVARRLRYCRRVSTILISYLVGKLWMFVWSLRLLGLCADSLQLPSLREERVEEWARQSRKSGGVLVVFDVVVVKPSATIPCRVPSITSNLLHDLNETAHPNYHYLEMC